MDSTAQTALATQKSSTKLLLGVTHGFDSWNKPLKTHKSSPKLLSWWCMDSIAQTVPRHSEIINETAPMGDTWIRQRKQSLGTHKSSPKLLPRWRMDSTAQIISRHSEILNELLPLVMHGLYSAEAAFQFSSSASSSGMIGTGTCGASMVIAWPSWKRCRTKQTATSDSKIINKTAPTSDTWIRQPQ